VVITGQVSHRIAMAALKASDLSIAPMQGSALLETLAAGLPTVAYDHETHAALIETHVNGVLVPHRDTKSASAELRKILLDSALASSLGQKARDRVADRYNVDAMRTLLKTSFVEAYQERKPDEILSSTQHEEGAIA
jgi:glycosyltransferase involved in cell wall biosynthesis